MSASRRERMLRGLFQGKSLCLALLLSLFLNAAGALGENQIGGSAQVAPPPQ
jgi:hypothetical protein